SRTALHHAAGNGHLDTVRLLLDKGADIEAKYRDWYGTSRTALHNAAGNGHLDTVRLLLDRGFEIHTSDD
ncbi:ankyrin, partial [Wilcoxina mikolae CBS 423.85]